LITTREGRIPKINNSAKWKTEKTTGVISVFDIYVLVLFCDSPNLDGAKSMTSMFFTL